MVALSGRLHPRLCDLSVCCDGPALIVLSREFVDRVFRDVIDCCAVPHNSSGATPRGGSSDRSAGCPGLRGECLEPEHGVLAKWAINFESDVNVVTLPNAMMGE